MPQTHKCMSLGAHIVLTVRLEAFSIGGYQGIDASCYLLLRIQSSVYLAHVPFGQGTNEDIVIRVDNGIISVCCDNQVFASQ